MVPAGRVVFRNEALIEDDGQPDVQVWNAFQHQVQDLPDEALLFLLASRYCEVDSELKDIAWSLFGRLPAGWPLVQAVCDYVHRHIRFDYMRARANRTARGFSRARWSLPRLHAPRHNILPMPQHSRGYCTGYLGDIGVPLSAAPMDFSAWLEVYLGREWHAFDARNNTPRIGRVLMARRRDAADVALTTTFGENQLLSFQVWTGEVSVR